MAKIETLQDNFNDNSVDTGKWLLWHEIGLTALEQNNQIELTTATGGGVAGLESVNEYDLTGSSATIKVVDAGNQALSSFYLRPISLASTITNWHVFYWEIKAGLIKFLDGWYGVDYSATYVANTHRYLRIREASDVIYADYSADGINWTEACHITRKFVITSMKIHNRIFSTSEASATTAKIDDFNILPSAVNTTNFFAMF